MQYYDRVIRGTEREDSLVIVQFLKGMIGKKLSFLNYYKEIPVSYDAKLLSVENEMAEFEVHDYQAKTISMERKTLIHRHETSPVAEDLFAEAFYVNIEKKRVILCKFGYAKICSDMRRFVRVVLDIPVLADLATEGDIKTGRVFDMSLGGAAILMEDIEGLQAGQDINLFLKLPNPGNGSITEVGLSASVAKILGESAPYKCVFEFHPEKNSQQQIAYFINQRQVEIIKELKDLVV